MILSGSAVHTKGLGCSLVFFRKRDGYPRRNGLAGGRNGNAETRCDHLLDMILVAAAMTGAPLTVRGKR